MKPIVLVTRADGAADPLVVALEEADLDARAVPTVLVDPEAPAGPLDAAAGRPEHWDWVVVTSRHGVAALAAASARTRPEMPIHAWRARWAAVGPGTAAALRERGIEPALVPTEGQADALGRELFRNAEIAGTQVLLPRASAATSDLPEVLRGAGATVTEVVAYRTVIAPPSSRGPLRDALCDPLLVAGVVASGSAIDGLVRLAESLGEVEVARARSLPLVTIGPVTTAHALRLGLSVAAEAAEPDVPSLVVAVLAAIRQSRR